MRARCIHCKWHWGISVRQEIPRPGYECPLCAGKRKRARGVTAPIRLREKQSKCILAQKQEVYKYV